MKRLYGVPCDRPDCKRVVASVAPYCCRQCEAGDGHGEGCERRQEAWREQEDVR